MKFHFQNKFIHFTLANILPVDETMNKSKKDDVKIKTSESGNFPNQFHCGIC